MKLVMNVLTPASVVVRFSLCVKPAKFQFVTEFETVQIHRIFLCLSPCNFPVEIREFLMNPIFCPDANKE